MLGDLDFAVANQWEASFLYRNDRFDAAAARAGDARDFLGLRLLLPVGQGAGGAVRIDSAAGELRGRPAIGASVRVVRSDGRILVGQVDGGSGHSGVRSPELHFGLGDSAAEAVEVLIRYRDRNGNAQSLELLLDPGWHSVLLPDGGTSVALAQRGAR